MVSKRGRRRSSRTKVTSGVDDAILRTMLERHRELLCLVVALALLVAGCSSGGGKQSVPTTTAQVGIPPSTATGTKSHVVANLGRCPKGPNVSLAAMNTHVAGLNNRLVPIRVLNARACQYSFGGRLIASPTLGQSVAMGLQRQTNQLSSTPVRLAPVNCGANAPSYIVTFVSSTQRVSIASYHCGRVVNGAIVAQPSRSWLIWLQELTPPGGIPRQ
jgi:hypothetical protein